jgi:hypothetical protein
VNGVNINKTETNGEGTTLYSLLYESIKPTAALRKRCVGFAEHQATDRDATPGAFRDWLVFAGSIAISGT